MAIYSPLRSRRLAAQQTEATQRLIIFKLGQETFALPLDRVHKVTTLDTPSAKSTQRLYGDPDRTGVSLTTYQGRELVVMDVGHRIFGKNPQILPPSPNKKISAVRSDRNADSVRYLLILQLDPDRLLGLPIDSPPSIQSIQISAFQPLPDLYRQHSNIHGVSAMSLDRPDRPSIFLLDVDFLAQPLEQEHH
jgi:chemotaxis signal transduction protein